MAEIPHSEPLDSRNELELNHEDEAGLGPEVVSHIVDAKQDGMRLDQVAALMFPEFSRSKLQAWIKSEKLLLDGNPGRSKDRVELDSVISLEAVAEQQQAWQAEDLPLNIVYQDGSILVINKPAGLVVHPGAGNSRGTLANAVLHHFPSQQDLPRAGIVHRLDKDTSGLLVLAMSQQAHQHLVQQLQSRTVKRQYFALAFGQPPIAGRIDKPIGRHLQQRQKMAVREHGGKPAITHYQTLQQYDGIAAMKMKLETGRTHQIRVHMAALGFPLIGDKTYGGSRNISTRYGENLRALLNTFPRQALHAQQLGLVHPHSGEQMEWQAGIPEDLKLLLNALDDELIE